MLIVGGKVNLVDRKGSKSLEFAKSKNAIELASEPELAKVLEAGVLGESRTLHCVDLSNLYKES